MPGPSDVKRRPSSAAMEQARPATKLGVVSGVYIPVCLNIFSILMFLRFGLILGQVGLLGIIGLLITAYFINSLTALSLSAIASNGEVKGGGAYYLISRSLGPEFGGSIGVLFYLAQVLNAALNVVGLIDCIRVYVGDAFPQGFWSGYGIQTAALFVCTGIVLGGSGILSRASNGLLVVLSIAVLSIPASALFRTPFRDETLGIDFTGINLGTLVGNFAPDTQGGAFRGLETFRDLFGILFPATSGIFAGASLSGDLRNPSRAIPKGTLWAMLTTFISYLVVVFALAASTTRESLLQNPSIISLTNLYPPLILAGEVAVTFVSAVLALTGASKLLIALAKDQLVPGLADAIRITGKAEDPFSAVVATYAIAQLAMLANLNQIATFISMGYQMTFFVMNLACFLLKIGSAPNFRPAFKFFSWQTAFAGSLMSAMAMFFINGTYAALAVCLLVFLFSLIHYLSPPKQWGDVSQNLIYHQVRKYLLRLRPEHIKFWRPQIILLINNPRNQTRLIQFCNSMKKGSLYILGHVIVTDDFDSGVHEARLQQSAWTKYISESSRIKAFVQLTMSPSINWGIRNLILSAGLGGMRPNIAVIGFYNMDELRKSSPSVRVPEMPMSPTVTSRPTPKTEGKATRPIRRRGDTSARLLEGSLPTDVIRTEDMMSVTSYMTMLEDLALKHKLNVAVGKGFQNLETPRPDGTNTKKYIDLWPIQMSAEVLTDGKSVLTTNFDTYTLILQLGYILQTVPAWKRVYTLRVIVFVEYESEVAEERARVKALLDKLRIDAKILVFWLACGDLRTYEYIINGRSDDTETETVVNDVLKNEDWWDELQTFRGRMSTMGSTQEMTHLANIIESTAGRAGVFNPHVPVDEANPRRLSGTIDLGGLQRRPTVSRLARLGVNMGIHTSHLGDDVFEGEEGIESRLPSDDDQGQSSSESESDTDDGDDLSSHGGNEAVRRPLLSERRSGSAETLGSAFSGRRGRDRLKREYRPGDMPTTYGTLSAPTTADASQGRSSQHVRGRILGAETFPELPEQATSRDNSGSATPIRPVLSRQSSAVRFSSRPVPETKVTVEETAGPTIMFAEESKPAPSRPERPTFSRQSSTGRFSSRPVPEHKVSVGDGAGPTITFAEPPLRSRKSSVLSDIEDRSDVQLNMSDILEGYRLGAQWPEEDEEGSPYSTQALALSFNDLPSRAQHLILNELMRSQSSETAVLFTTLPIPSEGTCLDEEASVQYLSNVEVLCHDLPPVLLVLSNNMTVTVGL
ncbi:hypothetical protein ACRALDRAFT_1078620 [Sodiomyces alcalophilus JCM 7366]|uniref:uncharacterized protein n=1 Tax=Sodiomyces alcalophilus JCM 7366 TaxID=591952 RepID=UPI0039B4FB69